MTDALAAIAAYAPRARTEQGTPGLSVVVTGRYLRRPSPQDRTAVPKIAEYAGAYRAAHGTQLVVSAAGSGARLRDGSALYALLPRDDDTFWKNDPRFARFSRFLPQ